MESEHILEKQAGEFSRLNTCTMVRERRFTKEKEAHSVLPFFITATNYFFFIFVVVTAAQI